MLLVVGSRPSSRRVLSIAKDATARRDRKRLLRRYHQGLWHHGEYLRFLTYPRGLELNLKRPFPSSIRCSASGKAHFAVRFARSYIHAEQSRANVCEKERKDICNTFTKLQNRYPNVALDKPVFGRKASSLLSFFLYTTNFPLAWTVSSPRPFF